MKNNELKTIWKLAKTFWISATVFWILETVLFLIIEGWHLKATNPIEIELDNFVMELWKFSITLTTVICVYYIFNLNAKSKTKPQ